MAADTTNFTGEIQRTSKRHLMTPYFDQISQSWVHLCCSFYNLSHPFSRSVISNAKTYNSSVIACVLVDLMKLLDYKLAVNNTKVLNAPTANQTLLSIANSYIIAADNNEEKILYMPRTLATNYNYTSLFSPDLVRYTGFSKPKRVSELKSIENGGAVTSINFTENLVIDPLDPTLVDAAQIHVRSMNASMKHPIDTNYIIRSIMYFNMEDLTASKSLIVNNINAAQHQITFLALIVIIIICAVVICISFQ